MTSIYLLTNEIFILLAATGGPAMIAPADLDRLTATMQAQVADLKTLLASGISALAPWRDAEMPFLRDLVPLCEASFSTEAALEGVVGDFTTALDLSNTTGLFEAVVFEVMQGSPPGATPGEVSPSGPAASRQRIVRIPPACSPRSAE